MERQLVPGGRNWTERRFSQRIGWLPIWGHLQSLTKNTHSQEATL